MLTTHQYLTIIEQAIASIHYPSQPDGLYAPIRYTLECGGKRLRPMLVLASCQAFGADPEAAINQAVGIEMFHNFTLLHDDIMDNAPVRRGKPSVYRKWSPNVAILSGDAMMIYAYRQLGRVDRDKLPEVMECFDRMAMEVCEGQQYDMDFENRDDVTIEEYMNMIRLKTSVLLAASVRIGAMLGGAPEADCDRLYRFAVELGLAFQLQDDLLDSYDAGALGKKQGGDILEGKKTFLMITALNASGPDERRTLCGLHRDPALSDGEKIARTLEIFDRHGVKEATEESIRMHFSRAWEELEALSVDNDGVEALRDFARSLVGRRK